VHPQLRSEFPALESESAADTGPSGARIVGRERELAKILEVAKAAARRTGRLMLVAGEPGVGKTRLAREVLRYLVDNGFHAMVGHCFQQYRTIPFFPFSEALADSLPTYGSFTQARPQAPYSDLRFLTDQAVASTDVDAQAAQLRMFRALTVFLRTVAASRPLLLLLEDLHWADSASVSALLYLSRHLSDARLLILGTYRDVDVGLEHPLDELLREVAHEDLLEEVALRGLSVAQTGELIQVRIGVEHVPPEFQQIVHSRSGGNPLFTQELLKVLVEQGKLDQHSGLWETGALDDIQLPRSVRSTVRQRLSQLPVAAQVLIQIASVVGAEFELGLLTAASGYSESDILDALDAAIGARLLEERRGPSSRRFGFSHILLQQATYEDVPIKRRGEIHREVADALERSRSERAESWVDLARHWMAAGEPQRAIQYVVLAADHAAHLYAHAEAVRHYRAALELGEQADERAAAELRRRLGAELGDLNRRNEAIAQYEAAMAYYEGRGDAIEQARVHREIAWVYQRGYDFGLAIPHLEQALRMWPEEFQDSEFAWLLFDASRAKAYGYDFDTSRRLAEHGLTVAERLGDQALQARGLVELASLQANQGAPLRLTRPSLERAEGMAERVGDRRTLSRLHAARAMVTFWAGNLVGAKAEYRREVQVADGAGLLDRVAFSASMAALTCMELGDWSEGREVGKLARATAERPPFECVLPWLEGDFGAALALGESTLADARARRDIQGIIRILTLMADFNLQLEEISLAAAQAREAVNLVLTHGYMAWVAAAYAPLAEAAVRADLADAQIYLDEGDARVRQAEQEYGRPQLLRARGLLLERRGNRRAARDVLQQSMDVARAQQVTPQLARTLVELIRVADVDSMSSLAGAARAEHAAVVERIGRQEVGGLPWATAPGSIAAIVPLKARRGRRDHGLSVREREVATLVAQGRTTREIASTLIITERMAENHLKRIFSKLDLRSHSELAAWSVEHPASERSVLVRGQAR
jgi:DNA-binding CsgD family transcriptional regulator/tetratricopeptide (TPR) repeat protein